ncbi:hypothetical protein COY62_01275 [bacterium (Candidatus Howlettbacteria) CG_4_10_14_0_8_um_filter_40_9]|nr:MAG: hypothetical protein COY62_01275 [bacterium (Candidatus Howlettbacteria) CG_4_10_14_0_8_um_filter_40_9]
MKKQEATKLQKALEEFKTYHNHRQEPYFTFLKNGQKTIEGRLQKGWRRSVEHGDHIIVHNNEETDFLETEVLGVRKYKTINDMLEGESLEKMLPDVNTLEEGRKVYKKGLISKTCT